ncbi:S-adenosyl-L-methionine-dependent methyltransferase [Synechococcus sp. RS9909]|uniref:class I SAM-dependent methyltransferase n=1 Tax=unclassified Synechococcus TaxID=2626047 RepID=UPI000324F15E|nr:MULTISPECIES: class I SAM-dependent methyltransferase [unclassified Synechococcus]QNI78248.1 S-adenosyl-L-methionine-dependent methyltransferase [Synechococcus sp. RS9909]
MSYPDVARTEILDLLPSSKVYQNCLDIGCGTGATSYLMLKKGIIDKSFGVDSDPDIAKIARKRLTYFKSSHAEDVIGLVRDYSPDLVLMLDVLEHMSDPKISLQEIAQNTTDSCVYVVSLPNVSHYTVLMPLLLKDHFYYDPMGGILDSTHLRFFTYSSMLDLFNECNLSVANYSFNSLIPRILMPISPVISRLPQFIRRFFVTQYIFLLRKN